MYFKFFIKWKTENQLKIYLVHLLVEKVNILMTHLLSEKF